MDGLVIVDSSLALAWVLGQPQPNWARRLRMSAQRPGTDIRVPTAFWLEVGNILVRHRGMTHDQMLEGLIRLESMGLADVELDRPTRLRALGLAFRHRLTTYDAVYLALAVDMGARLATLDEELGQAASRYGLRYGDDRPRASRESGPGYHADRAPDPVALAAIGAYIARFRRIEAGAAETIRRET